MKTRVDAVPTLLGRLVLLSSILDREAGIYQPWLIGLPHGGDTECAELHHAVLMNWLSESTEAQASDAVEYFKNAQAHEEFDPILLRGGYTRLLPLNIEPVHEKHFLQTIPYIIAIATRS